jgi:hypothetical protein
VMVLLHSTILLLFAHSFRRPLINWHSYRRRICCISGKPKVWDGVGFSGHQQESLQSTGMAAIQRQTIEYDTIVSLPGSAICLVLWHNPAVRCDQHLWSASDRCVLSTPYDDRLLLVVPASLSSCVPQERKRARAHSSRFSFC